MHEVSKRVLFRTLLKGGMSKVAISRELGSSHRTATRWAATDVAGRDCEALVYGPHLQPVQSLVVQVGSSFRMMGS